MGIIHSEPLSVRREQSYREQFRVYLRCAIEAGEITQEEVEEAILVAIGERHTGGEYEYRDVIRKKDCGISLSSGMAKYIAPEYLYRYSPMDVRMRCMTMGYDPDDFRDTVFEDVKTKF